MTGVERLEARRVCRHRIAIAVHEMAGPSVVIFWWTPGWPHRVGDPTVVKGSRCDTL